MIVLDKKLESTWIKLSRNTIRWPRSKPIPEGISDEEFVLAIAPSYKDLIGELWETYTRQNRGPGKRLLTDKKTLAAYLLGFHLPNAARMTMALDRLAQRAEMGKLLGGGAIGTNFVDIGCGTGALSHTWYTTPGRRTAPASRYYLVDAWDGAIDIAVSGLERLGQPRDGIEIVKGRIEDRLFPRILNPRPELDGGRPWVLAFGYSWNEIRENPKAQRVLYQGMEDLVASQSPVAILILDPAQQSMARALMETHNSFLDLGFRVMYPCPHQMVCPMLERSRDWCYSDSVWRLPHVQRRIDKLLHLDREHIATSAYVYANPAMMELVGQEANSDKLKGRAVLVGKPTGRTPAEASKFLVCTPKGTLESSPARETQIRALPRGALINVSGGPFSEGKPQDASSAPSKAPLGNPQKGPLKSPLTSRHESDDSRPRRDASRPDRRPDSRSARDDRSRDQRGPSSPRASRDGDRPRDQKKRDDGPGRDSRGRPTSRDSARTPPRSKKKTKRRP